MIVWFLAPLLALAQPAPSVTCRECHAQRYDQWLGSRHASSASNALFVSAFKREPMGWCLKCHAGAIAAEGIGCNDCHVRDGAVVDAKQLAEPALCGRCHQFDFPGGGAPMQDTLAEWQRSPSAAAGRTCQDCHMRAGDHHFPGGHNRALLAGSVSASVERIAPDRVRVTLHGRGVGHRLPTGDPFRRFVVELCDAPACDEPLARPSFGRAFVKSGDSYALLSDRTVQPGASEQVIDVRVGAAARHWRLLYAYAAGSSEPDLDGDDARIELARGVLPPQ